MTDDQNEPTNGPKKQQQGATEGQETATSRSKARENGRDKLERTIATEA